MTGFRTMPGGVRWKPGRYGQSRRKSRCRNAMRPGRWFGGGGSVSGRAGFRREDPLHQIRESAAFRAEFEAGPSPARESPWPCRGSGPFRHCRRGWVRSMTGTPPPSHGRISRETKFHLGIPAQDRKSAPQGIGKTTRPVGILGAGGAVERGEFFSRRITHENAPRGLVQKRRRWSSRVASPNSMTGRSGCGG